MKRIGLCLFFLMAAPASAQTPATNFPLDRPFKAERLNGRDVSDKDVTLTVTRAAPAFRGSGGGGCNRWNAGMKIAATQLTVSAVATTRRFCGEPLMKIEAEFVKVLQSGPAWRREGARLILTSSAGEVTFTSARR